MVFIGLLKVEMYFIYHTTTSLICNANLSLGVPRSMSPPWQVLWPKKYWKFRGKKYFIKIMNLINSYCHLKTELIGEALVEKNEKMNILRKRTQMLKSCLFCHFMTIFYNFALKKETIWAKRVVNSISENENPNFLCMFNLFTFRIFFKKSMQCKKE